MTTEHIRLAARWLLEQARRVGRQHAAHLLDKRHKPRRVVTLPRDVVGRWTRQEPTA